MATKQANAINAVNTGIQSFDGTATFNGRTITGTANQISVTNGDGTGGNPTLALTSTIEVSGISFDSGSHTLSTYTTGTFSPTLTASSSNPTVSYSIQVGRYTKIGNMCIATWDVTLSSFSGGTGTTQMDSLPFTINSATNYKPIAGLNIAQFTCTGTPVTESAVGVANTTFANVVTSRSAAANANEAITQASSTTSLKFTLCFEV